MRNRLFLVIFFILAFINVVTQSEDKNKKMREGNWLLSRIPSKKKTVNTTIESAIRSGLMPQAMERNKEGVFFFLFQTVPPARVSKSWQLVRYTSERKLMEEMRRLALEGWTPIGMDVQKDGAFVQYGKNGLRIVNARMIRIRQSSEIENTVRIYRDLGFFPAALSTYGDELWFLFAQYENINVRDFQIFIKSGDAALMQDVIAKGLVSEHTQFVDMAITVNNNVIMVFIEPTPLISKKSE